MSDLLLRCSRRWLAHELWKHLRRWPTSAVHDWFKHSGVGWPMNYLSHGWTLCGSASQGSTCMLCSQTWNEQELCQKASPKPFKESEESSTSSESQSDDDKPIQDNPPSKKIRLDLEDIQGIVTHKLEELCCRNNPDSIVPKFVQEDALEYLQDHTVWWHWLVARNWTWFFVAMSKPWWGY
jgi:hypothetical protein